MLRKGIILAGGSGSRLFPLTRAVSKQLLPVYDKPMIYYPLSALMLAGIRDVLVISTPRDLPAFVDLLADGSQWGMSFSFMEQAKPDGIAQAYLLAEDYLAASPSCLVLGDNIFYGAGLAELLQRLGKVEQGAVVLGYRVRDPQRYGVIEIDKAGKVLSLEEKPAKPRSPWAIPGLYFCDAEAPALVKTQQPSARGELEITDLLTAYHARGQLQVERLGRGVAWLDTGTHPALVQATVFIEAVENRQSLKVACPEEIAWRQGFIDNAQLEQLADELQSSSYGEYLAALLMDP